MIGQGLPLRANNSYYSYGSGQELQFVGQDLTEYDMAIANGQTKFEKGLSLNDSDPTRLFPDIQKTVYCLNFQY